MKREIKFRGFSTRDKQWVYGDILQHYYGNGNLGILTQNADFLQVEPSSVGQFTGLRDNTEKEIYEGDILRYSDCKTPILVEFREGAFCYNDGEFVCYPFFSLHRELLSNGRASAFTVIGNIYCNPELLK